jgi:hypothetical protein
VVNHHIVLDQVARVDRPFLFLNLGPLLSIAFIPFPTRVLAEFVRTDDGRDAVLLYGAAMLTMSATFPCVWLYAYIGRRLIRPDADPPLYGLLAVSTWSRARFSAGQPATSVVPAQAEGGSVEMFAAPMATSGSASSSLTLTGAGSKFSRRSWALARTERRPSHRPGVGGSASPFR